MATHELKRNVSGSGIGSVNWGKYSIFFVTIIAFLFLTLTRPNFFRYANIYSLVFGLSMEFLLVIGITLLLIMGEIDVSVGSVFAFAGVFTGYLTYWLYLPVWLAIPICLCATGLIGFVNGFFVVRFRANSLMITIGSMILFRGVADGLINFLKGITYPSEFRAIANFKPFGVNVTMLLMFVVAIVLEYLLLNHASFRKLFYIGENINSAKLYGIRVNRIKHTVFVVTSVTAGLAGIFAASRSGQTVWNTGQGLEFKMITAAILGGASLFGGKGSVVKSLFGLFLLAIILNGLVMHNIDPVWTDVVVGIVLIIAIVFDTRINKEKLEF
jgi:ribose/xylose/arabinose/galactoside ABC-type transport system permease subunit